MLNGDQSGRLRKIHDQLVNIGLKTRMPSNSSTLLFEAIGPKKERIGLAALRDSAGGIFSFPKTYWITKYSELATAASAIDGIYFLPTEGPFSSSQYSLHQIRITENTKNEIQKIIDNFIRKHFNYICKNQ